VAVEIVEVGEVLAEQAAAMEQEIEGMEQGERQAFGDDSVLWGVMEAAVAAAVYYRNLEGNQ
jgi:hypothetical protein